MARDGQLNLSVQAEQDADLEIWAANEAAKSFREVYLKTVVVQRAKQPRA
jgi:hypothetical protein